MNNTLTKKEYIIAYIFWGFHVTIWLSPAVISTLPGQTLVGSLLIYALLGYFIITSGIFLTWKRERNYISIAENLILTWGVLATVSYFHILKNRIMVLAAVGAAISILVTLCILYTIFRRRDKVRKWMKMSFHISVSAWRFFMSAVAAVYLVTIVFQVLLYGTVRTNESTESAGAEIVNIEDLQAQDDLPYGEEHTFEANAETICKIVSDEWEDLPLDEKLYVCQAIVDCDAQRLGIPFKVAVDITEIPKGEGTKTLAYYRHAEHLIAIDKDYLLTDSGYSVIRVLYHELAHAYQYAQVDVYLSLDEKTKNLSMFKEVAIYCEEMQTYVSGRKIEDYDAYEGQRLEVMARDHANEGATALLYEIDFYLEQKNKPNNHE